MQQIFLGGGGASESDTYWITELKGNGWGSTYHTSLSNQDDDGNVYSLGIRYNANGQGYKGTDLVKLDKDGAIVWQICQYSTSNKPHEPQAIMVTQDGSAIYVSGQSDEGMFWSKYNSSGTNQWDKTIGSTTDANTYGNNFGDNFSEDAPIFIGNNHADNGKQFIMQLTNAGAQTWLEGTIKNTGSSGTGRTYHNTPRIDGSGNIHYLVWSTITYPNYSMSVIVRNSSGVLQSNTGFNAGTAEDFVGDMAIDSSGNKYITTRYVVSGTPMRSGLMKLNSSNTIQWQKQIYCNAYMTPMDVHVVSGGDIISRFEDRTGNTAVTLTRHQSDGTLVWKRRIKHSTWSLSASHGRLKITKAGNMVLSFARSGGDNETMVAQLPGDGSLTGTHGNWIWEDATDVTSSTMTAWTQQGSSNFSDGYIDSMAISSHANLAEVTNNMTSSKTDVD